MTSSLERYSSMRVRRLFAPATTSVCGVASAPASVNSRVSRIGSAISAFAFVWTSMPPCRKA